MPTAFIEKGQTGVWVVHRQFYECIPVRPALVRRDQRESSLHLQVIAHFRVRVAFCWVRIFYP